MDSVVGPLAGRRADALSSICSVPSVCVQDHLYGNAQCALQEKAVASIPAPHHSSQRATPSSTVRRVGGFGKPRIPDDGAAQPVVLSRHALKELCF